MDHVTYEDKVMQEEIFGPVMPVLTYNSLDELIGKINSMPHPLALYFLPVIKWLLVRSPLSASSVVAVSTTLLSISRPVKCLLGDLVKVVWVVIMAVKASGLSPIIRVSWTKKHGWICQ